MTQPNPFDQFLRDYRNDPVRFVKEVLGVEPDPWQAEFLSAVAKGERRISIRSGHGVGKSSSASWAMIWFVLTRYPVKVVVTAPTSAQLYDALFAETKRWVKELPAALQQLLEVKQERIELKASGTEAFISARTSRAEQPEALQGIHCFAESTVDVLTRRGWVALEEVTLDDEVMSKAVGSRQGAWDRPLEVINAPYSGPMVSYEGRFLRFLVTPGHKFEYERRQCNKLAGGLTERWVPEVRPIAEMQRQICRIPTTFLPVESAVEHYQVGEHTSTRYGVPLATKTANGATVATRVALDFDIGDWAEFVGWYLAEGSFGRGKDGVARTVSIAQSRDANWSKYKRISDLVESLGFRPSHAKTAVNLCNVQVAKHLEELCPGKSFEKRVPAFAFEMPSHAIRRMLDGMRLGDGYGDFDYLTSSPGMAEDVQRLIVLAGGYATINKFDRKGTRVGPVSGRGECFRNTDYYRIREWHGRSVDTALIRPEKRKTVEFTGRVSCLRMPKGMFYVRDRQTSKPFWTHNSEHVMLIADEASGVPEQVFEAAAGSMSGHNACTILLGNPTKSSGFFFDTHHRLRDEWWTRRVSCADSPRVSEAYIAEMASRYGEDSNAYRIRVLGEFPLKGDDTVIPVELVEGAMHRDVVASPKAQTVWGLDVARFGADKSALCKRQSNVVSEIRKWAGLDLMQLCGAVMAEWQATGIDHRPVEILVDSIGLGAGVVDRLRELGLPARGINVSESPAMGNTYVNLRAELWFKTKAWLEARDCKIPNDEGLFAELVGPRFSFTSAGKMKVEAKDEMKRRGLQSPDMADALCLTFASDAATALYGRSMSSPWAKPIKRNIPRIA
jgi:hypothetical protein